MSAIGLSARFKGGPGSGNFGHEGRPGLVGGSASGSGRGAALPGKLDDTIKAYSSKKLFASLISATGYGSDIISQEQFFDAFGGREAVRKDLQKLVDNSAVYMAIGGPTLRNKIIGSEDKTFKNSMETRDGTFKTIAEDRAIKERMMFGIDAETSDYDAWPKYGFLADREVIGNENIVGWGYGEVYVKFKDAVKGNSTMTLGDSYDGNRLILDEERGARAAPPSIMNDVNEYSMLALTNWIGKDGNVSGDVVNALRNGDRDYLSRGTYLEAQMYGKLGIEDVAEIQTGSIKEMDALNKSLSKAGLSIPVVPLRNDKRLKFLSEGHYSGEGSYIAASLNDTDIDNLGDYYIDKLAKRWIDTSRSVEKNTKGKWTPPEELKSGIRAEKLSSSEKRSWLKKFYKRMAMGKDSGYIDAWWKDYRKSIGGFTADIAHKPLLEKYYE